MTILSRGATAKLHLGRGSCPDWRLDVVGNVVCQSIYFVCILTLYLYCDFLFVPFGFFLYHLMSSPTSTLEQ